MTFDFSYFDVKKTVTIGTISPALSYPYRAKYFIHTVSGTDTGTDLYCDGILSDLSDLRIAGSDGNALDFWIVSDGDGTPTEVSTNTYEIWVEFPTLATGTIFYVYYGYWKHAAITSESDGPATFPEGDDLNCFYDHFESLDTDLWNIASAGDYTVSDSVLQLSTGRIASKLYDPPFYPARMQARVKFYDSGSRGIFNLGFWTQTVTPASDTDYISVRTSSQLAYKGSTSSSVTVPLDTWMILDIVQIDATNTKFYKDGTLLATVTGTSNTDTYRGIFFENDAAESAPYANGPLHGRGSNAFQNGVLLPDGRIVLAAYDSDNISYYDSVTNTITAGPTHGRGNSAFCDAVLASTGNVILIPYSSGYFGLFNPSTHAYSNGCANTPGATAFIGGVEQADGKIALVPYSSEYVGVYDPVANTYANGPAHGQGSFSYPFSCGVLLSDGNIILVPGYSAYVGIYDSSAGTYANGDTHGKSNFAFMGGVLLNDGRVLFVPYYSSVIGLYDPDTDTYSDGPAHGRGYYPFYGGVLLSDGKVALIPYSSGYVGIFDPSDDSYTDGPAHGRPDMAFKGGVLISDGRVVMVPYQSTYIGLYDPNPESTQYIELDWLVSAYCGGLETPDISTTSESYPVEISYTPSSPVTDEEITFSLNGTYDNICWDFGDDHISYESEPDHSYESTGTYTVTASFTDSSGNPVRSVSDTITIIESGEVAFYAKEVRGVAPFEVMFINESPESCSAYLWDFGDGETSTDRHPVHEYTDAESYTVKLTITHAGVSTTLIRREYIQVTTLAAPVAGFTHDLTDNTGSVPVSVSFTDASTGTITSSEWDFGDRATSTDTDPDHTYSRPGYYLAKRIVRNADWEDTLTQLFYIRPKAPTVRIHADVISGPAPLTVIFTPVIIGPYLRLEWDFGDDTTSVENNPSHTYTTAGTYTVTLSVWNSTTLHETTGTKTITAIDPALYPAAAFSADVTEGEYPLTVTFTDASTGTPTSWLWDFGDTGSSTDQSPEHTYSTPGTYTVSLTATNAVGSDTETKTGYITAGADPVASFSVDADIHHLTHEFSFTDESLYEPTSWLWDFGDTGSSTDQSPEHTYAAAQSYWVTLTVTNAYGTTTKGMDITVLPVTFPIPSFTYITSNLRAPYTFRFTDTSLGTPTSWLWDFGDGTTSTDQNPTHTYQFPGTYTVSLTATNAYGTVTVTEEVLDADN